MFTDADVNGWFFTIAGLDPANGNTQPVPEPFLDEYVNELNAGATPAQIQANLENFPFNSNPPPTNVITDTFFRTSVADFVLREFQLAWGVVPTSGAAASQYDAWVARVINDPALLTNGGMSQALAGTTQFMVAIGATSPDQPATIGMINALAANAGVAVGSGAQALVGQPIWVALQTFATSTLVSNAMAAPIANFQNLLLAGGPAPTGSLLTLPGTPGSSLTLTTGVDTPTTGFSGHGATALAAGSIFNAGPANNPPLGTANTLNAGDDLETRGAAIGATTLNYTSVNDGVFGINPPLVSGLTMNGVNATNIENVSGQLAGFSGNITGLTSATLLAGSTNNVRLGLAGNGLNTALTDVTVSASQNFTAFMTAAALAAAPSGTVHLTGVGAPGAPVNVALNVTSGTTGYGQLTVDTGGGGANNLTLNTNATNTATVVASGAEFLQLQGTALDIANLHTFTGTAAAGGLNVTFNVASTNAGHVAATGGAGDDTFRFDDTAAGAASFLSTSSVDGGAGTNQLVIQANHGAILDLGIAPFVPGSNITNIQTVVHETDGVATGSLTADLVALGSATTFDLAGNYAAHLVNVTDITNAQTVEFSGTGGRLTLAHTVPLGLDAQINFEMDGAGPGHLTLNQLSVATGLDSLNINSIGAASDNVITNVSDVDDGVNITGATHLTFGSHANPYLFKPTIPTGGLIDAHLDTGGVTTWLGNVGLNTGVNASQTFIGGTGGDTVHVLNFGADVVDFTIVGPDVVSFENANIDSAHPVADPAHFYNQVLGFTNANDSLNIAVPGSFGGAGGVLTNTDTATAVAAGNATNIFHFDTGDLGANATTAAFNYIKIDTDISAGGSTVQAAFAQAMGALGTIQVSGNHERLISFYDTTSSEAVFGSVNTGVLNHITAGSHINVIGLIHESAADYAVTTPHFVAVA